MPVQRVSLKDTCVWKRLTLHSSKAKHLGFDWDKAEYVAVWGIKSFLIQKFRLSPMRNDTDLPSSSPPTQHPSFHPQYPLIPVVLYVPKELSTDSCNIRAPVKKPQLSPNWRGRAKGKSLCINCINTFHPPQINSDQISCPLTFLRYGLRYGLLREQKTLLGLGERNPNLGTGLEAFYRYALQCKIV